jgi:hypothetical protein
MAGKDMQGIGGTGLDEVQGAVVVAASAFVLGLVAGWFLKAGAKQVSERRQRGLWHRGYERTVTYDENLPDSLSRREPAPESGQPRFGGTGALGVSPAAIGARQPEEPKI